MPVNNDNENSFEKAFYIRTINLMFRLDLVEKKKTPKYPIDLINHCYTIPSFKEPEIDLKAIF